MRIRKIKFTNHYLFSNTEFDFTNTLGETTNTIILAGENGVGKSLFLNIIFEFSNLNLSGEQRDEKRIFEIEFNTEEVEILKRNDHFKHYCLTNAATNIFQIHIDYNIIGNWEQIKILGRTISGDYKRLHGDALSQYNTRETLKTIFSDVEINFTPKEIQVVTSTNIDEWAQSERSNPELATRITQLLIDIQNIDALEFTSWARANQNERIDESKIDVRTKRFTSAFNNIFPRKRYKRIDSSNNRKQVVFEEDGREMTIDKLSSGEKQIVFRGGFLLKNKQSSKGALVLIDEPEISLHPYWQLKILSFFKTLFTNEDGEQTSQLIVSTHSPFIIHNYNRYEDKVIVLQKDQTGKTIISETPKFFSWTPEKIVREAFKIPHLLSEDLTTVFLEGETDEKYFNKSLEVFDHLERKCQFKWIGRINEKGNSENSGDTALNHAKAFFLANMDHFKVKLVFLYDNDTNKQEEVTQNIITKRMSVNPDNHVFKIGVENLLTLLPEINISDFYDQRIKQDNYGAESIIRELNKSKLCNFICNDLKVDKQKVVLKKIGEEIEKLENYFK